VDLSALARLSPFGGRTQRRVVTAIVITALIPLLVQLWLGRAILARVSATAFQPEFAAHLDRSLGVYTDLVAVTKRSLVLEGKLVAVELGAIPKDAAKPEVQERLTRTLAEHPSLASLELTGSDGAVLGYLARTTAVDPRRERTLTVSEPLRRSSGDEAPRITAVFATPRARFDELEQAEPFARAYRELVEKHRDDYLVRTYARFNALVLVFAIGLGIFAGVRLVRPVTKRLRRLVEATVPVAAGDLSVRVNDVVDDEVGDLARAFDRMLSELAQSRERLEFLRRTSEWQSVARRLAHEIKNPLTPIQLAVEECHRRYQGDDPAYRRIVQTTLEVVDEEVASLRRLVGEFSSFARLPTASLAASDLGDVLRDEAEHASAKSAGATLASVRVVFEVPSEPMPALVDREMLHRAMTNLLVNAAQAIGEKAKAAGVETVGRIAVSARILGDKYVIDVDDDGPGVDPELVDRVFDPYVTTKRDGTGLGLTILKKIVVDHGGSIACLRSPWGGARFRVELPAAGSVASREAASRAEAEHSAASMGA